ncbi:MAG: hypothetical protein EOO61_09760 [Hymenobacter sp.]|nr:MAG: hypothetical protein EOO61_09760 [Hymenobacter sp.]
MSVSHLEQYLAQLPDGWNSYPQTLANRDLLPPYLDEFPSLADDLLLAEPLRRIAKEYRQKALPKTVPAVVHIALLCSIRDRFCDSDTSFIFLIGRLSTRYVEVGLFRFFLTLLPARMMVLTAASQWERSFPGTTFRRHNQQAKGFDAVVTYPPNLFPEFCMRAFARSIQVLQGFSRQKGSRTLLKSFGVTQSEFSFVWEGELAETAKGEAK